MSTPKDDVPALYAVPDPDGHGQVRPRVRDEPAPEDEPGRDLAVQEPADVDTILEGTVLPWQRPAERRRVFAAWIIDGEERRHAGRWLVIYVGHTSAFHAVRVPQYVGRAVMYAPRGFTRAVWLWMQWVADAEGHTLRINARDKTNTAEYLALSRQRNDRVKLRWTITGIVAGVGSVIVGVTSFMWPWEPYALLTGATLTLGYIGRRLDRPFFAPAILTSPEAPRLTGEIVIRALSRIGNAQINQALSKGEGITFASECTRDGAGWRADVDLPYGVTVTDVMAKREELASGLRRPLGCVWPERDPAQHAGRLVLYVGDRDMATARQKPWPLLKSGKVSVFEPVPFGYDQRGRLIEITMMFENVLIGAIPRMGKTFTLRVLALATALDPLTEIRAFELKGTGDLSCLEPVAHHYGSGPDDETIYQCLLSLREVHKDLERRAKVIRGLPKDICPENKVTPDLVKERKLGLHPIAFIVDECQELYSHADYGDEAGMLTEKIIKRGPAMGVYMLLATQRPDKKSLPTGVSANVSIRLCLRVMGQVENDMILGTSSYQNGLRATTFTKRDKGVMYAVGVDDDALIVKSSYIDNPAAEQVGQRAAVLRKQAGRLTGHAVGEEQDVRPVSLVEDVADILQDGEDKLWCQTAVERLAELRPQMYAGWEAGTLTEALKPYGVATSQTWGRDPDGTGRNRMGFEAKAVIEALSKIAKQPL
jgi:S-DNA-T family DNA segregation ATPase FtsK/SpoIIIE